MHDVIKQTDAFEINGYRIDIVRLSNDCPIIIADKNDDYFFYIKDKKASAIFDACYKQGLPIDPLIDYFMECIQDGNPGCWIKRSGLWKVVEQEEDRQTLIYYLNKMFNGERYG